LSIFAKSKYTQNKTEINKNFNGAKQSLIDFHFLSL
jgi:hypothetical protein